MAQLRKVAKRVARTWLALTVVPAVVEAKTLLLPMHREMAAATAVMVLRRKAALVPDRAPRPASLENQQASFTLAAVVLVVQVHSRGIMLPPIPGAGVAVVAMLLALLPLGMAVLVVQELCA